jgi:TonB family protein
MPSDPKALLLLAAGANGLVGTDMKPWHLKASYQLFDWQGKVSGKGTYEEFWASPTKRKRIFTSPEFTQTEFTTDKGALRSGANEQVPAALNQIVDQLINPISIGSEQIQHLTLAVQENSLGNQKLECITVTGSDGNELSRIFSGNAFCLDEKMPVLRISMRSGPAPQVLHNSILRVQGHYLPQDLQGFGPNVPDAKPRPAFIAHVDAIETLSKIEDADFAPTPDAIRPPRRIDLSAEAAAKQLLTHPRPIYPAIAQALRVSGTVVLNVVIYSDGKLQPLNVVSGPAMLQMAAMECARKWTYKPFLNNGEPVEVSTTVSVPFVLMN